MNGPQDVGGAHGFGPVVPDPDDDPFHEDWEPGAFALVILMAATGLWSLDRSRFMRESLPHASYYQLSYYGIWLAALERLVADADLAGSSPKPPRVLKASEVRSVMARGAPVEREGPEPRFRPGDRVRVKPMNPVRHNRAPRYVRGKVGTIELVHGVHVFPDTSAHGEGEHPAPVYNVSFDAAHLWGADTSAAAVHVDLFEPYLEPA